MLSTENKLFASNFSLFIEQGLSQDWPVSAEVDLDDMEYHEGIADSAAISSATTIMWNFY